MTTHIARDLRAHLNRGYHIGTMSMGHILGLTYPAMLEFHKEFFPNEDSRRIIPDDDASYDHFRTFALLFSHMNDDEIRDWCNVYTADLTGDATHA